MKMNDGGMKKLKIFSRVQLQEYFQTDRPDVSYTNDH
jgi:hypothetical protein